MTNKEAITILKNHISPYDNCKADNEVNQAIGLAIKALKKRPQGECKTCRHRDPEDKKCDCGMLERAGCPFPVRDNYYCKYYEKGGAE